MASLNRKLERERNSKSIYHKTEKRLSFIGQPLFLCVDNRVFSPCNFYLYNKS